MNCCIITPDFVGPIRNGGIGTHCFLLARFLRDKFQANVTILYSTESMEVGTIEHWEKYFAEEEKWTFVALDRLPDPAYPFNPKYWYCRRAWRVHQWLKTQTFDTCFFQEWQASNFYSLQAKRCEGLFAKTLMITMMHSPSEWQREGMANFPTRGLEDALQDAMERYGVEQSDIVLSPSQHMFDWADRQKWKFPGQRFVLPYLLAGLPETKPTPVRGDLIIFFGRLETRKGLELFIQALEIAMEEHPKHKFRVVFLGKVGECYHGPSDQWIQYELEKYDGQVKYELKSDLDQPAAMRYLAQHPHALIVAPSQLDNLPFAILECVEMGLNILTTDVGGIGEIFAGHVNVVPPSPRALAKGLSRAFTGTFARDQPAYTAQNAARVWTQFIEKIQAPGFQVERRFKLNAGPASLTNPVLTVCIPHYNAGEFFAETLISLEKQTFPAFTVIALDDGSTDLASIAEYERLSAHYGASRGWTFHRREENRGIGATRNEIAGKATTEFLVFMDADNIADPKMLEVFWQGMTATGLDCLTCHAKRFNHGDSVDKTVGIYIPTGTDLAAAMYDNILGDGNFIIKRDVFNALGGFKTDRNASWEDFELLVHLLVAGYQMDVVPRFLFRYRILPGGFSKVTSAYHNRLRGLRPAWEVMPDWQQRFLLNAVGTIRFHLHREVKKEKITLKPYKHVGFMRRLERRIRKLIRPKKTLGR